MKRNNRYIFIPVTIVATILWIFVCMIVHYNLNSVTGEEWFLSQDQYMEQLEILTNDLDSVTTLYLDGVMSYDDYKVHTETIYNEFILIKKKREQDAERIHIKEGSHTYITKKGCEAVDQSFDEVEKLILVCCNEEIASNPNNLAYQYIASQQAMINAVAPYITARAAYDPEGMIHAPSTETNVKTTEE